MGEQVEWVRNDSGTGDRVDGDCWSAGAYDDGCWRVFMGRSAADDFGGAADDLASAKLAAEAALRERGLVGGDASGSLTAAKAVASGMRAVSAAMRDASAAFAALADAMQTPQGRRVLAMHAVEEAVADGARRGLDAEALRVVLADAVERCSGPADSYIGSIVRDLVEYPDDVDTWPMVDYRRALAARSAKPLGRPSYRRRAW